MMLATYGMEEEEENKRTTSIRNSFWKQRKRDSISMKVVIFKDFPLFLKINKTYLLLKAFARPNVT